MFTADFIQPDEPGENIDRIIAGEKRYYLNYDIVKKYVVLQRNIVKEEITKAWHKANVSNERYDKCLEIYYDITNRTVNLKKHPENLSSNAFHMIPKIDLIEQTNQDIKKADQVIEKKENTLNSISENFYESLSGQSDILYSYNKMYSNFRFVPQNISKLACQMENPVITNFYPESASYQGRFYSTFGQELKFSVSKAASQSIQIETILIPERKSQYILKITTLENIEVFINYKKLKLSLDVKTLQFMITEPFEMDLKQTYHFRANFWRKSLNYADHMDWVQFSKQSKGIKGVEMINWVEFSLKARDEQEFQPILKKLLCRPPNAVRYVDCHYFCNNLLKCAEQKLCIKQCKFYKWDYFNLQCLKKFQNEEKCEKLFQRCGLNNEFEVYLQIKPEENKWNPDEISKNDLDYQTNEYQTKGFALGKIEFPDYPRELIIVDGNYTHKVSFNPGLFDFDAHITKLTSLEIEQNVYVLQNLDKKVTVSALKPKFYEPINVNDLERFTLYSQRPQNKDFDLINKNQGLIILKRKYFTMRPKLIHHNGECFLNYIREGQIVYLNTDIYFTQIPKFMDGFYQLQNDAYDNLQYFTAKEIVNITIALEVSGKDWESLMSYETNYIESLKKEGYKFESTSFQDENLIKTQQIDSKDSTLKQCYYNNKQECKPFPVTKTEISYILLHKQLDENKDYYLEKPVHSQIMVFLKSINPTSIVKQCSDGTIMQSVDLIIQKKNQQNLTLKRENYFELLGEIQNMYNSNNAKQQNLRNLKIHANINDCVWSLDDKQQLHQRLNISEYNRQGQYWLEFPGKYESFAFSSNKLYAIDTLSKSIQVRDRIFHEGICSQGDEWYKTQMILLIKLIRIDVDAPSKPEIVQIYSHQIGCLFGKDDKNTLYLLNQDDSTWLEMLTDVLDIAFGDSHAWVLKPDKSLEFHEIDLNKNICNDKIIFKKPEPILLSAQNDNCDEKKKEDNPIFKIEKFASNYNGCLWALDLQGRLFYRTDIGNGNVRGNSWKLMDTLEKEGLYFSDLTLSSRDLWLVTLNGYLHVMPNVCF